MKKFFLVLLLLLMTVPAGASVLVYNMKTSDSGTEGYWNDTAGEFEWYQWKGTYLGYLIIGPGDRGESIVAIAVWTGKDGKQKYAYTEDWGQMDLVETAIIEGKKTKWMWILTDGDSEFKMLLTGDIKPKIIGSVKNASCGRCHDDEELAELGDIAMSLPATMAGCAIIDEKEGDPVNYRDLWTSKLTLTLNTKLTLQTHLDGDLDVYDAMYGLLDYLDGMGYYIYWPAD